MFNLLRIGAPFPTQDIGYVRLAYTQFTGEFFLKYAALFVPLSHIFNLAVSQSVHCISLTRLPGLSSLTVSITGVFLGCAKKQMMRVHAGWIVASVKNLHVVRNITVVNVPCHAMSADVTKDILAVPVNFYLKASVSVFVGCGSPFPTFIGIGGQGDLSPEANNIIRGILRDSHLKFTFQMVRTSEGADNTFARLRSIFPSIIPNVLRLSKASAL